MKEEILRILKEKNYQAMNVDNLAAYFQLDRKEARRAVYELKTEGLIFENRKKELLLCEKYGLIKGKIIKILRRFAVVSYLDQEGSNQEVLIDSDHLNGALFLDEVLFSQPKNDQAQVYQVINPHNDAIVGEYITSKVDYVIPDNKNYDLRITIPKEKNKGAQNGHKVVVDILSRDGEYTGVVKEIIGHKLDPKVDILSKAFEHGVPTKFPSELMDYVATIPSEVHQEDLKGRKDLTNHIIVTIDGEDAKDLDDAIEVMKNPDGTFTLGVHIADVSHYVYKNNPLDREAQQRGTSVYLTDYVIPMLPHALSNGICSLNEQVIRLTMSCTMKIDAQGEVIDYEIYPSYIKSVKRLTYTAVNHLFTKQVSIDPAIDSMMLQARELATLVRRKMDQRGYLDLDINEAKIIVDASGHPTAIELRDRGEAEKLIEAFMIAANETVASSIFYQNIPFLYRVHDEPQLKKITIFANLIAPMGYKLKGEKTGVHPKELQNLLNRIPQQLERDIVGSLLLRSLAKAKYDTKNIGHFGLASRCYTHFTSPIRRYPDLLVHRYLKLYNGDRTGVDYDTIQQELDAFGVSTSTQERRAIDLERDVEDMKKAEYMEDHVNEIFNGRINGVMKSGFFVELPNTIEGFVRYDDLNDDYYEFDETRMIAIGSGSKKIIKMGDSVTVKVKAASKKLGTIDFTLIRRAK